ncbi:MAG: peptidoglycan DD-metalloendopeptidase family protein [Zoogloeaceae bacterium]|jgi:lipoprotein NlpD|nr:peptidoglycan DD-metalloendopeptidase family protein [Zoogloeaceae bacterium]
MKPEFLRASLLVLCSALILAGCPSSTMAPVEDRSRGSSAATQPVGPGYYVVKKGDTLYGIALEYGQDYREMAAWNYLTDPSRISVGQTLRVWPPGATSASGGAVASTTPVSGGAAVEQRSLDGATGVYQPQSLNTETVKREPVGGKEPYSDARYMALRNSSAGSTAPVVTSSTAAPVSSASSSTSSATSSTTSSTPATVVATTPAASAQPSATATTTATASGIVWAWPADGKVIGGFTQSKGLEISGKAGDPVRAAADGKVVYTGDSLRGYGNLVIVKHNNTYLTAYAHNRKILVKEGQSVKRGAKIAEMGNSDSDVVKLHFEVRMQGTPVEPLNYLPKR